MMPTVSSPTVNGKADLLASGRGGGGRQTAATPLGYGPVKHHILQRHTKIRQNSVIGDKIIHSYGDMLKRWSVTIWHILIRAQLKKTLWKLLHQALVEILKSTMPQFHSLCAKGITAYSWPSVKGMHTHFLSMSLKDAMWSLGLTLDTTYMLISDNDNG